ncbi:hypothetical protein FMN63_22930 [Stappia sp. BW2]|uniref:hypothetical protein n=1 Tax=Stappia sp. BW2 TaxID=2592622 RepID=UPI0011DEAD8C|nr:hypothetical protein [Stappia sp. BW2]TYC65274.1 hypothetical protein FMN63_22930 [Stappia sp. BW2]
MKLNNTYAIALVVSGSILVGTTISSQAAPSDGSNLGECYNNWISHCNATTSGYPNSCYGESLDHCDGVHGASMTQIPGYKAKTMRTKALRKAKRTNARLVAPVVQPARSSN